MFGRGSRLLCHGCGWLTLQVNFATKKGVPGFIKTLEKAAVQLMVNEGLMTEKEQKAWKKNYSN